METTPLGGAEPVYWTGDCKKKNDLYKQETSFINSDCKWKRLIVSNLLQKMRIQKRPYSCCDFVYPVHPIRSIFSLVRV